MKTFIKGFAVGAGVFLGVLAAANGLYKFICFIQRRKEKKSEPIVIDVPVEDEES